MCVGFLSDGKEKKLKVINSIIIAFAMYSKVPMPKADWKKENMRYVMCAFPLVGALLGGLMIGLLALSNAMEMGQGIRTALFVVFPILFTGGIHLDGFMDTSDALGSWQEKERRLEILKDSHVGAMAVIGAISLCLLNWGIWWELTDDMIVTASIGFFISRVLSGFAVATFPCAKDSGLAATFQSGADQKMTRVVLAIEFVLGVALVFWWNPVFAMAMLFAVVVSFAWYYLMAKKMFGGITGDLAGWFLQVCECMMAGFILLSRYLVGLLW